MCWREREGLIKSLMSKLLSTQNGPINFVSLILGRKVLCIYELSDQEIRHVHYKLYGSSSATRPEGNRLLKT
jgi:hypothetical protein